MAAFREYSVTHERVGTATVVVDAAAAAAVPFSAVEPSVVGNKEHRGLQSGYHLGGRAVFLRATIIAIQHDGVLQGSPTLLVGFVERLL